MALHMTFKMIPICPYRPINIPQSDLSDTDSEEEHGYDSDVEREKSMDYIAKTYSERLDQMQAQALKPDLSSKPPPKTNLKYQFYTLKIILYDAV